MDKQKIVYKQDANYIQCAKCNKQLNILKDYDFYDLNNCFQKTCCNITYTLTQRSYVLNVTT